MNEKYLTVTRLIGDSPSTFKLGCRISIPASKILYMEGAFSLENISDEEMEYLNSSFRFWIDQRYLGTRIVFEKKYELEDIFVIENVDSCVTLLS